MNADCVVDISRIAAGHGDGGWGSVFAAAGEDVAVAFGQTVEAQAQAAEAVVLVGVGAGQVDDEIGAGQVEGGVKAVGELEQVGCVGTRISNGGLAHAPRVRQRTIASGR